MLSSTRIRVLGILGGVAAASCSQAAIAFNDFDAAGGYNESQGWIVGPAGLGEYGLLAPACQFTSAVNGMLGSITVAVGYSSGTKEVKVSLLTDASNRPGTTLESWTLTGLPPFDGNYHAPQVLANMDATVTLTAGTNYWVEVAPGDSTTNAAWYLNDEAQSGLFAESHDGGATYVGGIGTELTGAMEVTTTPEPFTLALCAGGLGLAFARRRKPKKG